jgi:hypothetical protein
LTGKNEKGMELIEQFHAPIVCLRARIVTSFAASASAWRVLRRQPFLATDSAA